MARLVIFLLAVWCVSTSRGELLALYPGAQGPGLVARLEATPGAQSRPFGHDNEGMLGLCVDAHSDIYVSADILGAGLIYRFDRAGQLRGKLADVNGTEFSALAIGPDGLLYAIALRADERDPSLRHATIVRFDRNGGSPEVFVAENASEMKSPHALAFAPNGNLYVGDANGVLEFDAASGALRRVLTNTDVLALTFARDGSLYLADRASNSVLRYDGRAGTVPLTFVARGAAGLGAVRGLTFDDEGNLCVSNDGPNAVLRFDGQNGIFLNAFPGERIPRGPTALAFLN